MSALANPLSPSPGSSILAVSAVALHVLQHCCPPSILWDPTTPAGPEAVSGDSGTVMADDIYSLGVVLWELVTLEVPQLGALRAPEVPRECPQQVADVIRACTQVCCARSCMWCCACQQVVGVRYMLPYYWQVFLQHHKTAVLAGTKCCSDSVFHVPVQQGPALRPTARELYALLLACPPTIGDFRPPLREEHSSATIYMDRKASSSSSGILLVRHLCPSSWWVGEGKESCWCLTGSFGDTF